MTKLEFIEICNEFEIEPAIALENEEVVDALRNRKSKEFLKEILENQF
jgi:hypothetical protein